MHTANVIDCLIWSVIALIVQIAVYYIAKIPVPNLSARIANGELGAGDLARFGVGGRGRDQRGIDGLLTMAEPPAEQFGKRRLPSPNPRRRRSAPACRTAGDGHARGGRRSLCADAARQLRPQPPRRRGVRHTGPDQHGVQLASSSSGGHCPADRRRAAVSMAVISSSRPRPAHRPNQRSGITRGGFGGSPTRSRPFLRRRLTHPHATHRLPRTRRLAATAENAGFEFHSLDGERYWDDAPITHSRLKRSSTDSKRRPANSTPCASNWSSAR